MQFSGSVVGAGAEDGGVSDSCWPKATAVYHLQMVICPLVEKGFDSARPRARPPAQSRWHRHTANRDVFFWHGLRLRASYRDDCAPL